MCCGAGDDSLSHKTPLDNREWQLQLLLKVASVLGNRRHFELPEKWGFSNYPYPKTTDVRACFHHCSRGRFTDCGACQAPVSLKLYFTKSTKNSLFFFSIFNLLRSFILHFPLHILHVPPSYHQCSHFLLSWEIMFLKLEFLKAMVICKLENRQEEQRWNQSAGVVTSIKEANCNLLTWQYEWQTS